MIPAIGYVLTGAVFSVVIVLSVIVTIALCFHRSRKKKFNGEDSGERGNVRDVSSVSNNTYPREAIENANIQSDGVPVPRDIGRLSDGVITRENSQRDATENHMTRTELKSSGDQSEVDQEANGCSGQTDRGGDVTSAMTRTSKTSDLDNGVNVENVNESSTVVNPVYMSGGYGHGDRQSQNGMPPLNNFGLSQNVRGLPSEEDLYEAMDVAEHSLNSTAEETRHVGSTPNSGLADPGGDIEDDYQAVDTEEERSRGSGASAKSVQRHSFPTYSVVQKHRGSKPVVAGQDSFSDDYYSSVDIEKNENDCGTPNSDAGKFQTDITNKEPKSDLSPTLVDVCHGGTETSMNGPSRQESSGRVSPCEDYYQSVDISEQDGTTEDGFATNRQSETRQNPHGIGSQDKEGFIKDHNDPNTVGNDKKTRTEIVSLYSEVNNDGDALQRCGEGIDASGEEVYETVDNVGVEVRGHAETSDDFYQSVDTPAGIDNTGDDRAKRDDLEKSPDEDEYYSIIDLQDDKRGAVNQGAESKTNPSLGEICEGVDRDRTHTKEDDKVGDRENEEMLSELYSVVDKTRGRSVDSKKAHDNHKHHGHYDVVLPRAEANVNARQSCPGDITLYLPASSSTSPVDTSTPQTDNDDYDHLESRTLKH